MMKKRRRIRFPPKINDDTMSSIVIYSLVFCAGITIAGMVLGAFDHDVSAVVGQYASRIWDRIRHLWADEAVR